VAFKRVHLSMVSLAIVVGTISFAHCLEPLLGLLILALIFSHVQNKPFNTQPQTTSTTQQISSCTSITLHLNDKNFTVILQVRLNSRYVRFPTLLRCILDLPSAATHYRTELTQLYRHDILLHQDDFGIVCLDGITNSL